jgi:hypothetical protein
MSVCAEQLGVPEPLIHINAGSELILRQLFARFGPGSTPRPAQLSSTPRVRPTKPPLRGPSAWVT